MPLIKQKEKKREEQEELPTRTDTEESILMEASNWMRKKENSLRRSF